ncbi:hypothetical protein Jab_1c21510 [Janthinobacterium sp. HH01]|uniref:DUF3500 domain-containing protein n=1 Tax=Janthinobacterium sp. HH01 TaxID=1198452 RepID=UPI0002AEC46F|nr:DUF3500 domain-containing protein [Janthinobacterium sp. HH01]ELX13517.1 hypothetical protein Jab_1c21510 [Janthinobacterium sp. HH01]
MTSTRFHAMSAMAPAAVRRSGAAVLARAQDFMATLSARQRADLVQDYTYANASRWHTFPQRSLSRGKARLGLRLGDLTAPQRHGAMALLAAATGGGANQGVDALRQHLAVDDWIAENGGGADYGAGNFLLAFIGAPAATGTWQLQFGGHHLALNHTYRDGVLAGATPSFRAAEPHQPLHYRGAELRPQRDQWEAMVRLLAALGPAQLAAATLARAQQVLLLGPEVRRKDWNFPARAQGVDAASLGAPQRRLLLDAIRRYVDDVPAADAAAIMARYERELDRTRIAFSGSKQLARTGDYVRIDGPSVWIELVMDPPHSTDQPHVHAVWRDKLTDYAGTRPPERR